MKEKLTYGDFKKAAEALEKADVPGEKLVMTSRGLYRLEETKVGTLWYKV